MFIFRRFVRPATEGFHDITTAPDASHRHQWRPERSSPSGLVAFASMTAFSPATAHTPVARISMSSSSSRDGSPKAANPSTRQTERSLKSLFTDVFRLSQPAKPSTSRMV